MLPLGPLDVLDVRPEHLQWTVERHGITLAALEVGGPTGTGIRIGERSWTLTGDAIPLKLALVDDADGETVTWCSGRRLRPGALVQLLGAAQDVIYSPRLGSGRLATDGQELSTVRSSGTGAQRTLRLELADRTDLADYAPGLLTVCLWRLIIGSAPVPPGGAMGG